VVDCITANGNPTPPVLQRIFWSITEGAMAMALLLAGGKSSLTALQAVSIIAGVPYTIIICFMCKSLWSVLSDEYQKEAGTVSGRLGEWRTGVIDVLDYRTFSGEQAVKTLIAFVSPWHYAGTAAAWVVGASSRWPFQVVYAVLFYGWILLLALNARQRGLWAVGWLLFVVFGLHLAYVRHCMRILRVRPLFHPGASDSDHRLVLIGMH
jgi:choline-glycine betaine transporter